MYSISINSNHILNSPNNDNTNLMEEKGDTVIMNLLHNLPHNVYGINPILIICFTTFKKESKKY